MCQVVVVGCGQVRRRLIALACALAFVPALSACGEDEAETFANDYRPLNRQILKLGSEVGKTVNEASGKSDEDIEKEFGALAQETGELQQKVDELEPPEDLQKPTDELVEAMGDAQDALRDIEKAAGESDPAAARRATIQLVTSSEDLRDARRTLERETR
jgi:hypothetical protein